MRLFRCTAKKCANEGELGEPATTPRRRATLENTMVRHQAISACLLRGSRAAPHRSSRQQDADDNTSQLATRYPVAQPLTRTAPLPAFALWIALCRSVLTTPSRPTGKATAIRQMRGLHNRLAERADGKLCLSIFTRSVNLVRGTPSFLPATPSFRPCDIPREPEAVKQTTAPSLESQTHTGSGPVSDGKSRQRPVTCGSTFCNDTTLQDNFYVDTFELHCSCAALHPLQHQVRFLGR